jgi:hypothetical protein
MLRPNTKNLKPPKRKNKFIFIVAGGLALIVILISLIILKSETQKPEALPQPPPTGLGDIAEMERQKLESMLPPDYNREKFQSAWENFLLSLQQGNIEKEKANQFMFALKEAVADGRLDESEANNIIRLMNEASKK